MCRPTCQRPPPSAAADEARIDIYTPAASWPAFEAGGVPDNHRKCARCHWGLPFVSPPPSDGDFCTGFPRLLLRNYTRWKQPKCGHLSAPSGRPGVLGIPYLTSARRERCPETRRRAARDHSDDFFQWIQTTIRYVTTGTIVDRPPWRYVECASRHCPSASARPADNPLTQC